MLRPAGSGEAPASAGVFAPGRGFARPLILAVPTQLKRIADGRDMNATHSASKPLPSGRREMESTRFTAGFAGIAGVTLILLLVQLSIDGRALLGA